MPRERIIDCGVAPDEGRGHGLLNLNIDDELFTTSIRIDRLARRLVADLPARVIDLLEIAGYVYAADAAIRRGGPTDRQMGSNWRRRLAFKIPVREPNHWSEKDIRKSLIETLGFLTDDDYDFSFVRHPAPVAGDQYFRFLTEEAFIADEALLFSGGLDSLSGALDELLSRNNRVVLVSHHSSTKLQKVQADLVGDLRKLVGQDRLLHVPVSMQLRTGSNRDSTHRSRSFFFAALGMATASMFGLDRVRFYENGVVSLNLPSANQVVGSRATRSTHPQALDGFGHLFSAVFERSIHVDNPFVWKTKTEIVELVRDLGAQGIIRHTRSCANVRDMTIAHPHCGVCSQCIDRRFAVLAAGLEHEDPVEAYAIDLLTGPRADVRDREIALGYVRNARRFAAMSPSEFVRGFGEIQRAVAFMSEPADAAAERLFRLHQRHGRAVTRIIDTALRRVGALAVSTGSQIHRESLVMLTGREIFSGPAPVVAIAPPSLPDRPRSSEPIARWVVTLGPETRHVTVEGLGDLRGAASTVVRDLAQAHLDAAGRGLTYEDYPLKSARTLASEWDVTEEGVRKRISRTRTMIRQLARGMGLNPPEDDAIVENVGWMGYRLNPEAVRVVVTDAKRASDS